jgi:hypothetical protein
VSEEDPTLPCTPYVPLTMFPGSAEMIG